MHSGKTGKVGIILALLISIVLSACGDATPQPPTSVATVATTEARASPTPPVLNLLGERTPVVRDAPTPIGKRLPTPVVSSAWQEFISDSGRFSISLPSNPRESDQSLNTEYGNLPVHTFVTAGQGAEYTVLYIDLPSEATWIPAELLLPVMIAALQAAEILDTGTTTQVTVQGHPGVKSEYALDPAGYARSMSVLAGARFYTLVQMARDAPSSGDDASKFFDSFAIK